MEPIAMNRKFACIATVLSVLLLAGLMRAQDGGTQPAPQLSRKVPSSVGRLLSASPEENAERLTLLSKLERPITIAIEDKPLRECIEGVLAAVEIHPLIEELTIAEGNDVSLDDPATITAQSESVRSILWRFFRDHSLAWTIRAGKMIVTTESECDHHLETLVYDVTDLVTDSKGGAKPWELVKLIQTHVREDRWQDVGGEGYIEWLTRPRMVVLIVKHSPMTHMEISHALTALREMGLSSFPTGEIVELPGRPAPLPPVNPGPGGGFFRLENDE
jgi:hypothetical protein